MNKILAIDNEYNNNEEDILLWLDIFYLFLCCCCCFLFLTATFWFQKANIRNGIIRTFNGSKKKYPVYSKFTKKLS